MGNTTSMIRFGEVYWMRFEGEAHVQRGIRPGVVIQNDIGNQYSPNIIVVPITSVLKKRSLPTHVFLPADETGMPYDSIILCENPVTVPRGCLLGKITALPHKYLCALSQAALVSMPFAQYIAA